MLYSNIDGSINSGTLLGNRLIRFMLTKSINYKSFIDMYSLEDFYMFKDSRYTSNYRKNVYWIHATTSTANTAINQDYTHNIIFFITGTRNDCNIEDTRQIHFQQYAPSGIISKIDINIILYAYDNNPTPIKQ